MNLGPASPPRRDSVACWLLGGVALLLLGAIATVAVRARTDARWRATLRLVERERAQMAATTAERPVLYGDARPGDAWSDYEAALLKVEALGARADLAPALEKFARGATDLSAWEIADVDREVAPLLSLLHFGAHRASAKRASADETLQVLTWVDMIRLARGDVGRRFAAGDHSGACHQFLDVLQTCRDVLTVRTPVCWMVGQTGIEAACAPWLQPHRLAALPPAALTTLRQGLIRLEASLPALGPTVRAECVWLADEIEHARDVESGAMPGLALRGWRYGFSLRSMAADHVATTLVVAAATECALAAGPADPLATFEGAWRGESASVNPLTRLLTRSVWPGQGFRAGLTSLATLRVLRTAIAVRLGERVEALADPFGGVLSMTERDGVVAIAAKPPHGPVLEVRKP